MVQDVTLSDFRKLRLDTHSTRSSASPSPFASLPQVKPKLNPQQSKSQPNSQSLEITSHVYSNRATSQLSPTDLLDTLDDGQPTDLLDALDDSQESQDRDFIISKELAASNHDRPHSSHHSASTSAPSKENRRISVSFSNLATLDDGRQYSLRDPLPFSTPNRKVARGMSMDQRDSPDYTLSPRINPFTGELVRRRTRRTDATSMLDRIKSASSQDPDANNTPGLISAYADSPIVEGFATPMSSATSSSMLSSPQDMASATVSPDMWPPSGRESIKSRMLSRNSSFRTPGSRRSSRVSASSPASAFLSQWGKELASVAPEPDEEGQNIGVDSEYVIGRQIGFGGFSVVRELHSLSATGEKIQQAVKIVRKSIPGMSELENEKLQQRIEHEIEIWRYCQHKHILPLRAVYHTDFATFCVMDLVEGGTLFDLVRKSRNVDTKGIQPAVATTYAFQLATALRYLHEDIRIVHRDVKLENCLLNVDGEANHTENGGQLLLCDFGLAEFIGGDTMFGGLESLDLNELDGKDAIPGLIGTLQYAAPEAFLSKRPILHPSVDIWAFGVCVFAMITGELPFRHSLQPKIIEMITSGAWNAAAVREAMGESDDKEVTEHIVDLLDGCLEKDPKLRWTIADVLASAWFEKLPGAEVTDDW